MKQRSWMPWLTSSSDNLKPVLSHAEGSKTCTELSRSIQNLKWVGIIAIGVTFASCGAVAQAQQTKKVPRIGYLAGDPQAPSHEAFRQGLRDLGYVEGQSILIEWRYAGDKPDRLPELAAELVRLKVDVVVAANAAAVTALRRATTTIPIVVEAYGGDLVADGIVGQLRQAGWKHHGGYPARS